MATGTKKRIIETSLTLFNEVGFGNVTTARLAEALGISEGNLWYHFRTKTDLVSMHQNALFDLIDQRFEEIKKIDNVLEAFITFNRRMVEEMITYQYLYRDAPDYRSEDETENEHRIIEVYNQTTAQVATFFGEMIKQNHLDMDPSYLPILADNLWMIVRYWPAFLRETHGTIAMDKTTIELGMRHHFALFEHALSKEARTYFDQAMSPTTRFSENR